MNDRSRNPCRILVIAALMAAFAPSLGATPPKRPSPPRAVKTRIRSLTPVKAVAAVSDRALIAPTPWPPPPDKPGSPILPTVYPNVWVRFTPTAAKAAPGDKSVYVMPGASLPAGAMVPRAVHNTVPPVAIPLAHGGFAIKVDDSRTEYLVATRDAAGNLTLSCQSPAEPAAEGGAK